MHCQGYKFLSLSSINNGYHQLLSAVSEKKFNICDFHIHILNYVHNQPTSQVIKDDMQLYILPLVREIYKSESHQKSYHLMKTFG